MLTLGGSAGEDNTGGGRYLTGNFALAKAILTKLQVKEALHPAGNDSIYIEHAWGSSKTTSVTNGRFRFGLDAADRTSVEKSFLFLTDKSFMMPLTGARRGSIELNICPHHTFSQGYNDHNYNLAAWHQVLGNGKMTGVGSVRSLLTRDRRVFHQEL